MPIKIGTIIQVRMSSKRFPGKVLHEIAGKPLLKYLLERLEHGERLDEIVVATSVDDSDNPLAEFCRREGVPCYRGGLADVAGRFRNLLDEHQFDVFVRVNGDSPLLDQRLIAEGVGLFQNGDYDLVTNVFPRSYPKGQSVEVIRAATFCNAYKMMREKEDQEHITRHFYTYPQEYRIHNFVLSENLNDIQLSVDTMEDMEIFSAIVSQMSRPHWEYTLDEMIQIYYRVMKYARIEPS